MLFTELVTIYKPQKTPFVQESASEEKKNRNREKKITLTI